MGSATAPHRRAAQRDLSLRRGRRGARERPLGPWHQISPLGLGIALPLNGLMRDSALLGLSYLSWKTTRAAIRIENAFAWTPIQEVAILFAAIFITMVPTTRECTGRSKRGTRVAGRSSSPRSTAHLSRAPISGLPGALSSILDNAPTYLVFFNLAGGDAKMLMGSWRTPCRNLERRGVHGRATPISATHPISW